jgi:CHAP domain
MSITAALARITEIQTLLSPLPAQPAASPAAFAGALQSASTGAGAAGLGTPAGSAVLASASTAVPAPGGTSAGRAALAFAQQEVGQAEQPPGSNDSPRIAQFRQATAGSGVGPWCAYFVSWAARQAGAPLGDSGQGFGRVDDVWSWAERSGKAMPAGSGQPPQPGDLVVWDEHIGIVESVGSDGSIHTVEGNSSDRVSRRDYGPDGGGAIGYVRLG